MSESTKALGKLNAAKDDQRGLNSWYQKNKWPVRFALLIGFPPVAFLIVNLVFGMLPAYPGPSGALTILPANIVFTAVLGTEIPASSSAESPLVTVLRQAVFLAVNLVLWTFVAIGCQTALVSIKRLRRTG